MLFDDLSWFAWTTKIFLPFGVVISAAMELLARLVEAYVHSAHKTKPPLPHNPKMHLDTLESIDLAYIGFNKALTVAFVYHLACLAWMWEGVKWRPEEATLVNTVVALPGFFVAYDLLYASFHRALHARWCYRLVHKHHHRQISPTRGNYDAINVHPFEFLVGEYIHLVVIAAIPCHVATVFAFVLASGVLASLNHTRLAFSIPGFYDVKAHDTHHRWPDNNFGQYSMLWDKVFGWFRPYEAPKGM